MNPESVVTAPYPGKIISRLHATYKKSQNVWQIFADVYIPKEKSMLQGHTIKELTEKFDMLEIYAYQTKYTDPDMDGSNPQPYLIFKKGV